MDAVPDDTTRASQEVRTVLRNAPLMDAEEKERYENIINEIKTGADIGCIGTSPSQ
jgi:hypothetical protein